MYASALARRRVRRRSGIGAADRDAHARVGAVGDHRLQRGGVELLLAIEHGARRRTAARARPRPPAPTPRPAARAAGPSDTANVVSSGAIMPARAPASIDMLQTVIRSSIDSARIADPRYSMTWPVPPPMPRRAITASTRSLAVTPGPQLALDGHGQRLGRVLQQALRREHVRHLAGADAERERAERAVRAGVAVAAHDHRPRLGQPQLRPDDVHDALRSRCPARAARCRSPAQFFSSAAICSARRVVEHGDAPVAAARRGRRRVIHRRHRALGPAHLEAALAQPGERLRRGHLVHQVQVDVEDGGRVGASPRARGARPRSSRTSSAASRWLASSTSTLAPAPAGRPVTSAAHIS